MVRRRTIVDLHMPKHAGKGNMFLGVYASPQYWFRWVSFTGMWVYMSLSVLWGETGQ
jgi:hypothetical protein